MSEVDDSRPGIKCPFDGCAGDIHYIARSRGTSRTEFMLWTQEMGWAVVPLKGDHIQCLCSEKGSHGDWEMLRITEATLTDPHLTAEGIEFILKVIATLEP